MCNNIHLGLDILYQKLHAFPSIQMGLETAFRSFEASDPFVIFPSKFAASETTIPINGLIWMGNQEFMLEQLEQKLAAGFDCIKMKVGALNFEEELRILESIRARFSADEITLRVDANGAFSPDEAQSKLESLARFDIHSIEQPLATGQWSAMANLCKNTPFPIALDEELIGVFTKEERENLIQEIKPQYIILKPSLMGGIYGSDEWISIAEKNDTAWWITSALESNVGLNAISQFTYTLKSTLPQGLGTGSLFTNNIESPLEVNNGALHYNNLVNWDFKL